MFGELPELSLLMWFVQLNATFFDEKKIFSPFASKKEKMFAVSPKGQGIKICTSLKCVFVLWIYFGRGPDCFN